MQESVVRVANRIGVLILGRKRPGFDQEWNQTICRRSLATLKELGYATVGGDVPVVDDATIGAAIARLKETGCEALVMLQPSMGAGQLVLTVAQQWADPLVLWATPERPEDGKVSSCSLVGQHLWGASLRQAGKPFELVYGDPDDGALRTDLVRAISLARTGQGLRQAKIGVVGTHVPGFIDMAVDPFLLSRTMGIQLHPLSLPQFIDRVHDVSEDAVRQDVQRVLDLNLPMDGVTAEALPMNSRCYLAMLELIEEERLNALALQCWPELPNALGQWPYLAVSRLSTEGRSIAVEGDVDGCAGSLMSSLLGLGPGFLTDWLEHDRNTIFFWHPGMAPMNMCDPIGSDNGPTLANHFNIVKPLVVNARIRVHEPVTIMRLWRCDNRYHMTAFEGITVEPRRKLTGNSMLVELAESDIARGGDVLERFDRLLHAGMPHHMLVTLGKHAETYRRLARVLGLEWEI
ncbi:MAG: L-fucose/L-arabinose isomerase family protein [Terracidiphilus sp.]|nr:L-fucose/L-arabinose isomerase family protein [Terracidiphilus sp.]